MITAQVDMTGFTAGLKRFVAVLGLEAPRVIKQETAQLIKTLVRVTPPADVNKSKKRISQSIYARFEAAKNHVDDGDKKWSSNKNGRGDIVWYAWSPQFLYGVTKESDRRNDSVDELKRLAYTLTKGGRSNLGFVHPRQKQRVLLKRKILANPETLKSVVKLIQGHVGRLKAGWTLAIGKIDVSGIPAYVLKHKDDGSARGRYDDRLDNKEHPSFAMTNSGFGIGAAETFAQKAVDIRAKAMLSNFRLLFSGKKHLSDY